MEPEVTLQLVWGNGGRTLAWPWAWRGAPPSFSQKTWCCKPLWWICGSFMKVHHGAFQESQTAGETQEGTFATRQTKPPAP